MYMQHVHACALEGYKKEYLQKLEIQMVVSYHVGARTASLHLIVEQSSHQRASRFRPILVIFPFFLNVFGFYFT